MIVRLRRSPALGFPDLGLGRIIAANVVPEYQRWGIGLVLLHEIVPHALKWGLQEAEFSWVMESNQLSWRMAERGGAIRTKTYRLYDRDLD